MEIQQKLFIINGIVASMKDLIDLSHYEGKVISFELENVIYFITD